MSRSTRSTRKRVLLSAFACSPQIGSECGVGWRWALELARLHDVTVVTHAHFRSHIEPQLAAEPVAGLTVSYHSVPGLTLPMHIELNSRVCYWLWQATVRSHVKRLLGAQAHDLIHHLTWSSFRWPSFLGHMGLPFALGPIGGGEGAPARLYRSWPWRERAFYAVRQASIALSRWDPFVIWTMSGADCVLTKTRQTRDALPWFARHRAASAMEIGVAALSTPSLRTPDPSRPLQLLYAGRLLGGKGVPYALQMMKHLVDRGVPAELQIAGDGRLSAWTAHEVARLGLQSCVRLLGMVAHDRMDALFDASDLLVFPSWHDSGGLVVAEALARGLPVLCLDRGGPAETVNTRCAIVVPTTGASEGGVARAMADRVTTLSLDRRRLARMSKAALQRAGELTWEAQVRRAYDIIETRLGWTRSARSAA